MLNLYQLGLRLQLTSGVYAQAEANADGWEHNNKNGHIVFQFQENKEQDPPDILARGDLDFGYLKQ